MNQKKLGIGLFIALIALVSGISYAYFTASFQNLGTRETSITLAEMGSLKLTAEEASYSSGNQYPGNIAIQKFEVEPVTKGKGVYELDLTGVIDEAIFGTDVEIQLYKSIDTTEVTVIEGELTQEGSNFSRVDTLVTNGLTPVYTGSLKNGLNILFQEEFEVVSESSTLKIRQNSESTAYPKYTFYLVYNYKNNGNQNNQMGQTFSGTVSGKIIKEKSFIPVNAAEYIMNLAKNFSTPGLSYYEERNFASYDVASQNNFVYFNDMMPSIKESGYAHYYDNFDSRTVESLTFDTLEECRQRLIETPMDGTIECKLDSGTGKYYVQMTGYELRGIQQSEEACINSISEAPESVSCRPYSKYSGWQVYGVENGQISLEYTGDETYVLNDDARAMIGSEDTNFVLLKADINIIGGDGSANNPYVLELNAYDDIEYGDGVYYSFGAFPNHVGYQNVSDLKLAQGASYGNVFLKNEYLNKELTSVEVCLEKDNQIECFKPEYTDAEKSKIQAFFSDTTCENEPSSVIGNMNVSGYYTCSSSGYSCSLYEDGDISCSYDDFACRVNSNFDSRCINDSNLGPK